MSECEYCGQHCTCFQEWDGVDIDEWFDREEQLGEDDELIY